MTTAPGKKVLVVEDEEDVVEMLTRAFRRATGFNVIAATDGATGLRRAREESPALVVLDLMLPKMPGLEVCKILKSDSLTRHIPILMLTAKAEEIDRILGLELGADDYVSKPFSPREIVLRAQAILRRDLDDFILVSDDELRLAMRLAIEKTRNLVEAAARQVLQADRQDLLRRAPAARAARALHLAFGAARAPDHRGAGRLRHRARAPADE